MLSILRVATIVGTNASRLKTAFPVSGVRVLSSSLRLERLTMSAFSTVVSSFISLCTTVKLWRPLSNQSNRSSSSSVDSWSTVIRTNAKHATLIVVSAAHRLDPKRPRIIISSSSSKFHRELGHFQALSVPHKPHRGITSGASCMCVRAEKNLGMWWFASFSLKATPTHQTSISRASVYSCSTPRRLQYGSALRALRAEAHPSHQTSFHRSCWTSSSQPGFLTCEIEPLWAPISPICGDGFPVFKSLLSQRTRPVEVRK